MFIYGYSSRRTLVMSGGFCSFKSSRGKATSYPLPTFFLDQLTSNGKKLAMCPVSGHRIDQLPEIISSYS